MVTKTFVVAILKQLNTFKMGIIIFREMSLILLTFFIHILVF